MPVDLVLPATRLAPLVLLALSLGVLVLVFAASEPRRGWRWLLRLLGGALIVTGFLLMVRT